MALGSDWEKVKDEILNRIEDFSQFIDVKDEKKRDLGTGWVSALCPFHKEEDPSFSFSPSTGAWKCFAGCGKGSIFDFIMKRTGAKFLDVLKDLAAKFNVPLPGVDKRPPISEDLVNSWCQNLQSEPGAINWITEKRGLKLDTIKKFMIGWDPKRSKNTIPVRDKYGKVVNVRLYNAKKKPKICNFTDGKHKYGSPARLYGIGHLSKLPDGAQVILCEGEWDMLLLRQEDFNAVTGTGGCNTFRREWAKEFKGKKVVVLYDADEEGKKAANETVLRALRKAECEWIKVVHLPLKGTKDDKDVTDYLHKGDHTAEDLQKLIDKTPVHEYESEEKKQEDEVAIELASFTDIEKNEYIGKKVKLELTVCGETSESFHAVDEFIIPHCPLMPKGRCYGCKGVDQACKIPKGSREYIGSCMSSDALVRSMLREFACNKGQRCTIEFLKRQTIKEFFAHQRVKRFTHTKDDKGQVVQVLDGQKQEVLEKKVYFLSDTQPKPTSYATEGWVTSHPKTQQITYLIDSMDPLEEDYERFDVEAHKDEILAFRNLSIKQIITDLNTHVTGIFGRDEILLGTLVTYLSPRWIYFNENRIRGWVTYALIGDPGSGKTQTVARVADFLGVGDVFSGLTGSRTGLAYALVDHKQKGWQVKVGRYPANTRKLLIVDEAQYIPPDEIRTLSKAMEEGFLQIDRVQSRGYESQTRLILIGNPLNDRVMDSFSFGCLALESVYRSTIIRRLDFAVFANANDIGDTEILNQRKRKTGKALITSEMLRAVVYWAWKLSDDAISFDEDATGLILSESRHMADNYGDATKIPLVNPADFRNKLARISAAMAVLNVSIKDDDLSRVYVGEGHVRLAVRFLDLVYTAQNCSLNEYSEVQRTNNQLGDYEKIVQAFDKKHESAVHSGSTKNYFSRTVYHLRVNSVIRREDLTEQVGCSRDAIDKHIKFLKGFSLIKSGRDGYAKRPKFNKFIQRYVKDRPKFFEGVQITEDEWDDASNGDDGYHPFA